MTTDSLQIKGGSIRTKLEYVRDHFGAAAEADLVEILVGAEAYPILEANWYSFELFDRVLVHIADHHFDGDLTRLTDIGRFSARRALTGVYKSLKRLDLTDFLRRRLPVLHGRYYSTGRLVTANMAPQACRLVLTAPYFRDSDLYVAQGFYEGAVETAGHRNAQCRFERKDGRVFFLLTWELDS